MPKFHAIKFTQNNTTMYMFTAESEFMYKNFDVSRRDNDKERGYQRSFSPKRAKEIKYYLDLEKDSTSHIHIIPNSILVNIDSGKHQYDEKSSILELSLNNESSMGFIIDGQHRLKGAYEAQKDFLLPVIATIDMEIKDQAQLFVTINQTQKSVPSSLYLDLLGLIDGIIDDFDNPYIPVDRRAEEIARRLNEDEESPLYGLINMTGERIRDEQDELNKRISLSHVVEHMRAYVRPQTGKLADFGFEEQYRIFKIYFSSVKAVFLSQWEDEKSLILKTGGFGGLVKALDEIFALVTRTNNRFSTRNTIQLLQLIKDFKFDRDNLPNEPVKLGKRFVDELKKRIPKEQENTIIIED